MGLKSSPMQVQTWKQQTDEVGTHSALCLSGSLSSANMVWFSCHPYWSGLLAGFGSLFPRLCWLFSLLACLPAQQVRTYCYLPASPCCSPAARPDLSVPPRKLISPAPSRSLSPDTRDHRLEASHCPWRGRSGLSILGRGSSSVFQKGPEIAASNREQALNRTLQMTAFKHHSPQHHSQILFIWSITCWVGCCNITL